MVAKKENESNIMAERSFHEIFESGVSPEERKQLTCELLMHEATNFCINSNNKGIKSLYGVTDGKAVGTSIEKMFKLYLSQKYDFDIGNSGKGIDLPDENINTDIKVSSIKKPQSSSPYKDAKQKVFGLGYNLLLFVYDKSDNDVEKKAYIEWKDCIFIEKEHTADYTLTKELIEAKQLECSLDDIVDILKSKNIKGEESTLRTIANEILEKDIEQGEITVSNALQWRLNYGRIVKYDKDNNGKGVNKLI